MILAFRKKLRKESTIDPEGLEFATGVCERTVSRISHIGTPFGNDISDSVATRQENFALVSGLVLRNTITNSAYGQPFQDKDISGSRTCSLRMLAAENAKKLICALVLAKARREWLYVCILWSHKDKDIVIFGSLQVDLLLLGLA